MLIEPEAHAAFAVHRAAVDLLKVFLEGRCYDTINPYARKEFKGALEALAGVAGVSDWMDTETIFLNAPLSGAVPACLSDLARVFVRGDNYDVKNPYAREEVQAMLVALARDTGVADPHDTETIFARVADPEMAALKKEEAARKKALFDARVLEADIAFLTANTKCRVTTIGEWTALSNQESIFIRLGLPGESELDSIDGTGLFTVHFLPESTKVLNVSAIRLDTAESLLNEKPKTQPAMGV